MCYDFIQGLMEIMQKCIKKRGKWEWKLMQPHIVPVFKLKRNGMKGAMFAMKKPKHKILKVSVGLAYISIGSLCDLKKIKS